MGESGTGKELLARAIHLTSPYREGPFVVVDCTAIPETLLETELFGYEQGAFTDARKTKPGLLEVASGGTVFLDEIGDLPLSLQGKLLRVLEGKALRRVGGVKEIPVDFRLISATHTDLEKKVKEGRFREDLWYRICVAQISLPPLRERKEDIPLLVEHFLKTFQEKNHSAPKGITEAAIFLLKRYSWPGNIRELRNAIEYAVVVSRSSFIVPEDLPPHILRSLSSDEKSEFFSFPEEILNLPYDSARDKILGEFERRYFQNLLKKTGGNVSSAARIAQLHRSVLYRHFKRWNLPFREEENLEKE
jgi:transcriptional regulator with PAS, ATPase and Fis domain